MCDGYRLSGPINADDARGFVFLRNDAAQPAKVCEELVETKATLKGYRQATIAAATLVGLKGNDAQFELLKALVALIESGSDDNKAVRGLKPATTE